MAYDRDNPFAKILRGELPATEVYEDDKVLSFMDIMPQSKGHTLVIPKEEARNLFEITPACLSHLIVKTQEIAKAVRAAVQPDGVTILQFNGAAAGQTVFHLHFHVIPRWEGQEWKPHGTDKADPDELRALADRIKAEL